MANAFQLQLTLEGLDGSVQIEPGTGDDVANNYIAWTSTANNFVVAKTDSYITDIVKVNGVGGAPVGAIHLRLMVNGRDTGIAYLTAGIDSAVNNRMPSKPGIGEGASIQVRQTA